MGERCFRAYNAGYEHVLEGFDVGALLSRALAFTRKMDC
jgi:hypothetical protein